MTCSVGKGLRGGPSPTLYQFKGSAITHIQVCMLSCCHHSVDTSTFAFGLA